MRLELLYRTGNWQVQLVTSTTPNTTPRRSFLAAAVGALNGEPILLGSWVLWTGWSPRTRSDSSAVEIFQAMEDCNLSSSYWIPHIHPGCHRIPWNLPALVYVSKVSYEVLHTTQYMR